MRVKLAYRDDTVEICEKHYENPCENCPPLGSVQDSRRKKCGEQCVCYMSDAKPTDLGLLAVDVSKEDEPTEYKLSADDGDTILPDEIGIAEFEELVGDTMHWLDLADPDSHREKVREALEAVLNEHDHFVKYVLTIWVDPDAADSLDEDKINADLMINGLPEEEDKEYAIGEEPPYIRFHFRQRATVRATEEIYQLDWVLDCSANWED